MVSTRRFDRCRNSSNLFVPAKTVSTVFIKVFNNPVYEGLHPCWELYLGMNACGILQVSKMDEPLKGGRQVVANGMPSKVQCATNN